MATNNDNELENLKKSYLAAHQTLQFSKTNKTDAEVADIERRCLFTKYTLCKNNVNENAAGALLQSELENYTSIVDSRNGLNNYWKQFNSLNISTDNNPLNWKVNLPDPKIALQFIEKLPCQSESTLPCKNNQYVDRDVEKLMNLWNNGGKSPRARKISKQDLKTTDHLNNVFKNESKENKSHSSDLKVLKKSFLTSNKIESVNQRHSNNERTNVNKTNFAFRNENSNTETVNENRKSFASRNEYSDPKKAYVSKSSFVFKNDQRPIERREEKREDNKFSGFKSARTELGIQQAKNNRQPNATNRQPYVNNRQQPVKKSLGGRALNSPFVCPFKNDEPKEEEEPPEPTDERLKNIEPKMIELIKNEIMDCGNPISWDDIAGLEHAKRIIKEIVVFPMLRPDIFTGLRRPPKGILLFGPPGTGKTLIGKCIASQSKSTFFSISASSLTSKWVGEGEKMVRALFAVAQVEQPSVVFIDEIDSLLCQRSESEHESSRRMKTEFLVQLDGAATGDEDRILVIGATNRPYELDEAARRRLVKRLYVPLPELEARAQIVRNLLKSERHDLTSEDVYEIAKLADGYSGADMTNLCKEASMGPIRSIPFDQLEGISKDDVRKVTFHDFKEALESIRPSVSQKDLSVYLDWDRTYGTASVQARG